MKIKFYITIVFMVSMFILSSCEDALDTIPEGRVSYEDVFSDNDKVSAYLNSCYVYIPTKGSRYFFFSRGPVEWCDDAWDADAEAETSLMSGRMYNGNASSSSHPVLNVSADCGNGDYWSRYWQGIRKCTLFLSHIDEAKVTNEEDRQRWRAEAHVLRAYYYSELQKWFGATLPIETETYALTQDYSTLKKETFYDVTKFIIADCDAALSVDDDIFPWRIIVGNEGGRFTKAVAEAIKSNVILAAASPLFNGGQDYWEEAYTINKAAVENLKANGYELYNTVNYPTYQSADSYFGPDGYVKREYAALYNEYFTNYSDYSANPNDKETIYQTNTQGQHITYYIDGIGAQDGYKTGTCPSQELVDAYETLDGEPVLDLANPYSDEKHLQPNYNQNNSMYSENDPYANRDPRFYASIYYNGSKRKCYWSFDEVPTSYENYPANKGNRTRIIATYEGEPQTGISVSDRAKTRTGYYERKFLHPTSGSDNQITGAFFKTFRLGEVILNYAEAAAEAGHLGDARSAVNEIRARVGMPDIPDNLSQEEMILRVRHERQVELAMEENRYFDVRRWCEPTGDLSATDKWITAMNITRNADGTYNYERKTVRSTERKCYTNRYLLLPVPASEASILKASTSIDWQNPGW